MLDVDADSDGSGELGFLVQLTRASATRRQFLTWAGLSIAFVAMGCSKAAKNPATPSADVNLGSGDNAVLNYAYALEQLEAAFYTRVIATPYTGITVEETTILTDIRDHEVIHRDFLKSALGAMAIAELSVTFTSVDFTSRASVLTAARTFEDLGVSAYNGAGRLFANPDHLTLAGKIVSVEARHASVIRDLLAPRTAAFAGDDVVGIHDGLDDTRSPSQVLALADPFIVATINRGDLP